MSKISLLLVSFILITSAVMAGVTSGRLVYLNGSTATLYYDTQSSSYKDGSVINPNVYVELCADKAEDLIGNFTALYYRSGAINLSISLIPANITSVNASNCTVVDVDTSLYRAYYPGVVSVGFSSSSTMSNPVFYDLETSKGLLSGSYIYTDVSNSSNTVIHLDHIYYNGTNEITTDRPYLIVALYNGGTFLHSVLVDRSTDASFPVTAYDTVKVNNLTASTTTVPSGPGGGGGGGEEEKKSLYISIELSGYVGDPVTFIVEDEDGKQVRNARVKIYRIIGGSAHAVDNGYTNSDGEYTTSFDNEGDYYAVATKSGYYESDNEYFKLWKRAFSISYLPTYLYVENPVTIFVKDAGSNQPVSNAVVELYSSTGSHIKTCSTSAEGTCEFSGDLLADDGEYAVKVTKQYYDDGGLSFNVYLYPLEVDHPSDVYVRETFDVTVRSLGEPVPDAKVIFDHKSYVTNEDGKVEEISFDEEGVYPITVEKQKYQTYESTISASLPPIYPLYPNETYSKEPFTIILTSPDDSCISDAELMIGDNIFYSDTEGNVDVLITTPNNYTISISKEGCAPYKGIIEIPERPPEQVFEKGKIEKPKVESATEILAKQLGLESVIKSGCEGIYIEGIPSIICDFIWLLVLVGSASSFAYAVGRPRKLVFGFTPIIVALVTFPAIGAATAVVAFSLAYKSRLAERARLKALKEKEEKITRELEEGKTIEEIAGESDTGAGNEPLSEGKSGGQNE